MVSYISRIIEKTGTKSPHKAVPVSLTNTRKDCAFVPDRIYDKHSNRRLQQFFPKSLTSLLWALIIQRLFSIPTDSLLLTILKYSKELREFCGFTKVPDASKITRFKQEFIDDLQVFFDSLVDLTEPILQQIDADKASMSVFDTTGLEAYVTENDPKYANQKIRQLKTWAKVKGMHYHRPAQTERPYAMKGS